MSYSIDVKAGHTWHKNAESQADHIGDSKENKPAVGQQSPPTTKNSLHLGTLPNIVVPLSQLEQASRECQHANCDAGLVVQPHVAPWRDPSPDETPVVHTAPGESSGLVLCFFVTTSERI